MDFARPKWTKRGHVPNIFNFFQLGGGEGGLRSVRRGGGGPFLLQIPEPEGGLPGEKTVSAGNWGAKYLFSGPKFPPSKFWSRECQNPLKTHTPQIWGVTIHPPNLGGESSKIACFTVFFGGHSLNLGGEIFTPQIWGVWVFRVQFGIWAF